MTKLLGISGSLRSGSYNTMLVREAGRLFGADEFQMASADLPLFNEDVEAQGIPAPVQTVIDQIWWADAIVISTPEYNKAPSGALKNLLDWVSRPRPAPMVNKPVAVLSAAAGGAGGQRAKSTMYLMLIPFMVKLVTTPEVNVGGAGNAFDTEGTLIHEPSVAALQSLMDALKAEI